MSKGKWKTKNPLLSYTYQNINKTNKNFNQKCLNNWLANLFKQTNKIPFIIFLNNLTLTILQHQSKKYNTSIEILIINSIINQNKKLFKLEQTKILNKTEQQELIKFKKQLNKIANIIKIGNKTEQIKEFNKYLKTIL